MAFKENYKDEIASQAYQVIDNRTGAVLYPDVRMERTDTPTQVGDKFGAVNVNEIHKRLNDLDNGSSVVKKSYMSDVQRTFDISNVCHEDRLFNVKEINDPSATGGRSYGIYVQEPNGTIGCRCNYAYYSDNTAAINGCRVLEQVIVVNPAGYGHVYINCYGKKVVFANVINGNWDACKAHIRDIAYDGNLLIFFDSAFSTNIQLNVQMFYQE